MEPTSKSLSHSDLRLRTNLVILVSFPSVKLFLHTTEIIFSMFSKSLVVLAIVVTVVYGDSKAIKFHNCKSRWEIKEVRVEPCDATGDSCPLKRGTEPEISIKFVPNKAAKNLTVGVTGIVNNVPIPFSVPNNNACLNSGVTCPLTPGAEHVYKLKVPVLEMYPTIQVLIRFTLDSKEEQDEGEKKQDLCFIMKTRITN